MNGKDVQGCVIKEITRDVYGREARSLLRRCGATNGSATTFSEDGNLYVALTSVMEGGATVHLFLQQADSSADPSEEEVDPLRSALFLQRIPLFPKDPKSELQNCVVEKIMFSGKAIVSGMNHLGQLCVLRTGLVYHDDGANEESSSSDGPCTPVVTTVDHVNDFCTAFHPNTKTSFTLAASSKGIHSVTVQGDTVKEGVLQSGCYSSLSCICDKTGNSVFIFTASMDGSFQLFVLSLETNTSFPKELTLLRQVLMGPQCQVFGIAVGNTDDREVRFFALINDGTHQPNENGPIVLRGKDGKVLAVEDVSVDTPSPSPMLANIVKDTRPPSSHGSFLCMGVQPSDPSKTAVQSVGVSPSLQQVLEKCAVEDVRLSCDAFPTANGVYVALFAKSFIALVEVSPLQEATIFVYEPESDVTHIVGSSPVLVTDQRNTVCVLHGTRGADESTSGAVVNLKVLLLHNMKKMHTTTRQNGPLSPGVSEDTIRRIVREEVEKSNKGVNAKLDEIHGMLSRLLSLQGA